MIMFMSWHILTMMISKSPCIFRSITEISFELIYKEIGDIGRYQLYVLLLGWISGIYLSLIWINSVFLLFVPEHRYVGICPFSTGYTYTEVSAYCNWAVVPMWKEIAFGVTILKTFMICSINL